MTVLFSMNNISLIYCSLISLCRTQIISVFRHIFCVASPDISECLYDRLACNPLMSICYFLDDFIPVVHYIPSDKVALNHTLCQRRQQCDGHFLYLTCLKVYF